jgi:hypothetical protein
MSVVIYVKYSLGRAAESGSSELTFHQGYQDLIPFHPIVGYRG